AWRPRSCGKCYVVPAAAPQGGRPARPAALFRRLDAENGALVLVGDDIEQPVRPLTHVADTLAQIVQQHLAAQLLELLVEQDALELARARHLALAQPADEPVALPVRQRAAGIEAEARYGDGGRPVDDRRLEPLVRRAVSRLPGAGIGAAQADHRPAVIGAGLQDIQLVAAVRTVLGLPDLARHRVRGE